MKFIDITGQRFGRLTVIERAEDHVCETYKPYMKDPVVTRATRWRCRCDCGGEITTLRCNLVSGATRSCGCLRREHMRELNRKQREAKGCG
jgi:hypothetical protein